MINWFHRFFNPHCEHCREEQQDNKVCSSCETLKSQLEIANHEKSQLLNRLLEKPEPEVVSTNKVEVSVPKTIPWAVRRQMLESEDRKTAQLIKQAPKPMPTEKVDTADLEAELGIIEKERQENV